GAEGHEIPDEVALHHGQPTALVEVGDGDADGRTVDHVVGDQRALETELGIERNLAEADAGIAGNLQVRGRIAAHGRERRPLDAVAAHHDVAGAKYIDGIAVLPGAAGARGDVLDAVVEDERAVVAGLGAPHQDAVVGALAHRVGGDPEALRIEREDAGVARAAHGRARHLAFDSLQHDPVPGRRHNLAVADAYAPTFCEMHKAALRGKGDAGAVEHQSGERRGVGACRRDERRATRQDEPGCAAHADDLPARRQPQVAGTVDAGRERQRHACSGSAVDGRLQSARLVVGAAGAHAELGSIQAEDRDGTCSGPSRDERRRGSRGPDGGEGEEAAAVEGHGRKARLLDHCWTSRHFKFRAEPVVPDWDGKAAQVRAGPSLRSLATARTLVPTSGRRSTRRRNSSASRISRSVERSAVTVADRGSRASSAISPKKSPSSRRTLPAAEATSTRPLAMRYMASPRSPLRMMVVPAGTVRARSMPTRSAMAAASRRAKRGTRATMAKVTTKSRRRISS